MTIDLWTITGYVATLVILPILTLLILFISYLRRINYQLRNIQRILALAFPTETNESKDNYSRDSYLEKFFKRRRNRETSDNNLIHNKHNETNKVSHKGSIT